MHRSLLLACSAIAAASTLADAAGAQSLRGSRASIDRMYRRARAEKLAFYETRAGVRRAVKAGRLVPIERGEDVRLHEVGYPWVRPAVRTFVERLGAQYHEACGEPLVVTSAVRPATRQPANSTSRSVHPAGMAVDLRRPEGRSCLRWLRRTLLELEGTGVLEATEEHSPAHFHVAVFPTRYTRYVAQRAESERSTHYVVRDGDTLWEIAREHDTTVGALAAANDLSAQTIQPGQDLRIPEGQ
jgi:nucleoid-associated protein YgaU